MFDKRTKILTDFWYPLSRPSTMLQLGRQTKLHWTDCKRSLIWVYTVCPDQSVRKFRIIAVLKLFQTELQKIIISNEPRHKKTCLWGLRPGKTQTGLLTYRDKLESWNFEYRNKRYHTILMMNNKGADQTARMHKLICTFVVRIWLKQVFSWHGSNKVWLEVFIKIVWIKVRN